MPNQIKAERDLFAAYIRALIKIHADNLAEKLLIDFLNRNWEPTLLHFFQKMQHVDVHQRLTHVEAWLTQHKDEALFRILGQLCITHQLWGKAQGYFEAALSTQETPFVCAQLGALLLQLGQTEESARMFQRGLDLALV